MRVYLSYKFGDDISSVRSLLQKRGIDLFDSITDLEYGSSLQQSIKNAIKSSDFLIFIYSEDNPNIAFEAGIAVALNKPIFSILSGGHEDAFLRDSICVHGLPTEIEKIKFSFELFLNKLDLQKKRFAGVASKAVKYYGGGEAIPDKNYFDILKRYHSIEEKSGAALESFFEDVFKAYVVKVAKRAQHESEKWLPDFSVWSDELSPLLNNPVVIEIKSEISMKNIDMLLANLTNVISGNLADSIIIFYDRLTGITKKDLPITPNRLFISIPDFIQKMQSNGFASSIIKIRNEIAHNF